MSYILDALQRADAERERGHVPGLRSQIVPPAGRAKSASRRRWRPWHGVALMVAVLAAIGIWWWSVQAPPDLAPAPVAAPASTAPTPPAPPAPVSEASQVAAVPEPVQPILAPPRPEPPKPAPVAQTKPSTESAAPTAPPSPSPATTTAADTATVPVPTFAELSPEARARLPAVSVSGSTYSRNPALRMLIVNGKVLQEGQEIAPGLKLETIGQRNAVLNHQGLRYSIGY
ncbi:general secretion pathway protein GspB [Hydrogenophaga sp.]|uniref:general secretion pathway protein GspB n=1 Tax=Hydrogenophaga sp. TaxID=1904254 RepID=UPI003D106F75